MSDPVDRNAPFVLIDTGQPSNQRIVQKSLNGIGNSKRLVRISIDGVNKVMTSYHFDSHSYRWVKAVTQLPQSTKLAEAPLTYNAYVTKRFRGHQSEPGKLKQQATNLADSVSSPITNDIRYFGIRDTMLGEDSIPRL